MKRPSGHHPAGVVCDWALDMEHTMNDHIEQRLKQIFGKRQLYATEGAAFGPLLGSSFTFPKKPEFWTLAQLDAFRSVQLDRAKGEQREQLAKMWLDVIASRLTLLGEDYPLRQHPFIKTPEAVKAEFLALEPAIARPALSKAVDWSRHELVIAGHDLYWALDALLAVSSCPGKPRPPVPYSKGIPLMVSSVLEMPVAKACCWPLGVHVTHATKTQYAVELGSLAYCHPKANPDGCVWVTTGAGREALDYFLSALLAFCRESLLSRVTIAMTTPGGSLSLDSRPVEGIIVTGDKPYSMLSLDRVDREGRALKRVNVATVDALSTLLPEDATHREALVDEVLALWCNTLQAFPFTFEVHSAFVTPLAERPVPLSHAEQEEMLALAKASHPVVEAHVQQRGDGSYLVTRHDLIAPVPIAITNDVEFAIGLAIAHEVANPWRLGLTTRDSAA